MIPQVVYSRVIFLDGDGYEEAMREVAGNCGFRYRPDVAPFATREWVHALAAYLKQWDYGDALEPEDGVPATGFDNGAEVDGYLVGWSHGFGHCYLYRMKTDES